ncbi:MAG TPA: hypothetical protein VL403_11540 [Candidatus Kryptonia bacterium]|nr:hypothetical protein [Candidatus Kryptonia bacterium]
MRARTVMMLGLLLAVPVRSPATMYRSDNGGEFGILNPDTAAFTVLDTPVTGSALSGICLDTGGRMWGTSRSPSTPLLTTLIEINPSTGALINSVGAIKVGTSNLKITDLACQPGTGTLFGLDSSDPSNLYTIDKATGAATLVGTTAIQRGGLGFAPDGRLFAVSIDSELAQLDPANAQTIGSILDTETCLDGFAIRPDDGAAFATACDGDELYRVDLATGNTDFVGDMGDFGADVEFSPVVGVRAPALSRAGFGLMGVLLASSGVWLLRRRAA